MTNETKTYAITDKERDEVMAYLKRKPLDMDGADVVITLDLLPLITGEPLQPITADMVTDEMVIAVCSAVNLRIGAWGMAKPRELIAAAVNAVLDGMIKHKGDTK